MSQLNKGCFLIYLFKLIYFQKLYKSFVFKGTYVRGENLVLYYGDIFEMEKSEFAHTEAILDALNDHHQLNYVGAFYFKKVRDQD